MKRKCLSNASEVLASEDVVESVEEQSPNAKINVVIIPECETKVLALLDENESFYFKGKLVIEVLRGEVDVLGYTYRADDVARVVYSPRGYSLLNVTNITKSSEDDLVLKLKELGPFKKTSTEKINAVTVHSKQTAVLLLKKVDDESKFVEHHLMYSDGGRVPLFGRDVARFDSDDVVSEAERRLDVNLYFQNREQAIKGRLFKTLPDWENSVRSAKFSIADNVQPRLLVAGGKGVGKSTFVRYLTNRLLTELKSPILIIDLDPGQAEFSVPGCVSCVKVDEPVFGPNFTHVGVKKELCLFIGTVDVSEAHARYVTCVKMLQKKCQDFINLPWIINTMGFTQGLGLKLMEKCCKTFRPTTIIEIESRSQKKNFRPPNFLSRLASSEKLRCNILKFRAIPESLDTRDEGTQDSWGIPQPSKLRDIVLLSFFEISFPGIRTLQSVTPRVISWSKIFIQFLNLRGAFSKDNLLRILNTAFVSLGSVKPNDTFQLKSDDLNVLANEDVIPTLGFGVVRGIDPTSRVFYIITAVDESILSSINCLTVETRKSVKLPSGVFANQISKSKTVPYVVQEASECLLATPWQRHFKPRPEN